MEIRVLRYFLEIAREGNMSRAAERLHVTQPTLSKQMKDLEQELGKKLFKRGSTSVSLTDEGMLLRKRAEDLLALADNLYWLCRILSCKVSCPCCKKVKQHLSQYSLSCYQR